MRTVDGNKSDRLARRALGANALFSGVSGLALIVGSGAIGSLMGVNLPAVMIGIGIGLVVFALLLGHITRRTPLDKNHVMLASMADILWVLASGIVLLIQPDPLTLAGNWLIAIVADVVAIFAVLQLWGLRRVTVSAEE